MTNLDMQDGQVTWGNRVVTLLLIGVMWLIPRLFSEFNNRGWELVFWNAVSGFGTVVSTVFLVIGMLARTKFQQTWFRCSAFWVIPFQFVVGFSFDRVVGQWIGDKDFFRDWFGEIFGGWFGVEKIDGFALVTSVFFFVISLFIFNVRRRQYYG